MAREKKLGRGFKDLASPDVAFVGDEILQLPVNTVKPNRFQPRHDMNDDAFENLKDSSPANAAGGRRRNWTSK